MFCMSLTLVGAATAATAFGLRVITEDVCGQAMTMLPHAATYSTYTGTKTTRPFFLLTYDCDGVPPTIRHLAVGIKTLITNLNDN